MYMTTSQHRPLSRRRCAGKTSSDSSAAIAGLTTSTMRGSQNSVPGPNEGEKNATSTCVRRVLYVDPLVGIQHRKVTSFTLQMATVAYLKVTNVLYDTCKDSFEALEMISRTKYDLLFICDDMQNHIDGAKLASLAHEICGFSPQSVVLIRTGVSDPVPPPPPTLPTPYHSSSSSSSSSSSPEFSSSLTSKSPSLFAKELHQPSLQDLLDAVDYLVVTQKASAKPGQLRC